MMKGVIPGVSVVTALLAIGVVKLILHLQNSKKERRKYEKFIPKIQATHGNVTCIERFGDYVGEFVRPLIQSC